MALHGRGSFQRETSDSGRSGSLGESRLAIYHTPGYSERSKAHQQLPKKEQEHLYYLPQLPKEPHQEQELVPHVPQDRQEWNIETTIARGFANREDQFFLMKEEPMEEES